ncbi:hypothetical protein CC78DRAFT_596616, partial [Lojkania enalia]
MIVKAARRNAESIINEFYEKNPSNTSIGLSFSKPAELGGDELVWDQSAVVWDSIIAYSSLTGDTQFNDVVAEALHVQSGEGNDLIPVNQTNIGNFSLLTLSAAELSFPKAVDGKPTFLRLAQNVFNSQVERWDNSTCGGGLRNAIVDDDENSLNWEFKGSPANSNFFLMADRLYQLMKNNIYSSWAERMFTWALGSDLIDASTDRESWKINDGLNIIDESDCKILSLDAASNTIGRWLEGTAIMFNSTNGAEPWRYRLGNLSLATDTYLSPNTSTIDNPCPPDFRD